MANAYQKIKIKIIGNPNLTTEEERRIWLVFFDILLKKTNVQNIKNLSGKEQKKVAERHKLKTIKTYANKDILS